MTSPDQAAVVRVLREISLLLQLKGENAFKSRAYDIAADRLSGLTDDLRARVAERRLVELPGIGAALAEKITELVTTGRMAYYDGLRAEYPEGIFELLALPDLGPKKANVLWTQLQVGSVDALESACQAGKVRALKGFGEKTEEKILAGIALYRRTRGSGRRLLAEVLPRAEALLAELRKVPGVLRVSVGGSARRACETVGDLDLIVSAADPSPVFAALRTHPEVGQVIGEGESKCSVRLAADDLQVDLRVLPDEDFATALHHFTGSKAHHIQLRGRALDLGLKLSEWGLHRGDEKLRVPDEETLYRLLGLPFIPPELREGWGELEAALSGTLPIDLVQLSDVQGNVHAHSTWSDGRNSLEEMALAARALGLRYMTVTEHSQTAGYAGGLKEDDLKRQWDEIDEVSQKVPGIRLLKGIESDILEDGSLDYPERILEKLDVVIGSIHTRHGLDEAGQTKRVLNAFDNPHLHIWGHPTGRLLNRREAAGMRLEEILDKAAERRVVVEVNGNPERLDLKAEHVRWALQRGVKLVVSTDAHSVHELRNLPLAVATARKGWARKADVLNTLPAEEFLRAVRT